MSISLIYRSVTEQSEIGALEDVFIKKYKDSDIYTTVFLEKNKTCKKMHGRLQSTNKSVGLDVWVYYELYFETEQQFNDYIADSKNVKTFVENFKKDPEFLEFQKTHKVSLDDIKIVRDLPANRKGITLS